MATKVTVLLLLFAASACLKQVQAKGRLDDEKAFKFKLPTLPKMQIDEQLIADMLSDPENVIGEVNICTATCKKCLMQSATSCVGFSMKMLLPCALGVIATNGCLTME